MRYKLRKVSAIKRENDVCSLFKGYSMVDKPINGTPMNREASFR